MSVFLITASSVIFSIGIHYEVLALLSRVTARLKIIPRLRVGVAIVVVLIAHLFEIAVFACGYFFLTNSGISKFSSGATEFKEMFYFSILTYTSLGFGEITPLGDIRIAAGVEALTGLVLIAWTASFSFLQMKRYWRDV